MKEYTIKWISNWEDIPKADISIYKWIDNGYKPKAYTQLMHNDNNIYVRHVAFEKEITVKAYEFQGDVWKDSCMELFLMPAGDNRYLNFETNAAGVLLLHFGTEEEREELNKIDPSIFEIKSSVSDAELYNDEKWILTYKIPFSFLYSLYGEFDIKEGFYGNFYKCGDETKYEHYGMWSEIENGVPEFHLTKYFGRIYME